MKFTIAHETARRLRICLERRKLSRLTADKLRLTIAGWPGIDGVTITPRIASVAIEYTGERKTLLARLAALDLSRLAVSARSRQDFISEERCRRKKCSPDLKRKCRQAGRILMEAAFDLLAPAPFQTGYHLLQMVKLAAR
ncbi:hypothetical protein HMP0721_0178 [Pseudoramibacter alactolyticus ATCC 23263]|uniref:Uncharacterized protein n=1 Tax=Pseudoramibacter alactolyticus ATCC 23263 TaxID=887929 RepID=E6MDU5_9FIRM|nr:hypothetical protein [Pseudoramibacter alactolyticus]EFV02704.1 hypothetical protein HMP0721_0178 [Pseudoramibacter alactolyticus ATCC 23263]